MMDKYGNWCGKPVYHFQYEPRIWALIYNGILHSVANGARTNAAAVELLELNDTPVFEIQERNREQRNIPNDPTPGYGRHAS